MLLHITAVCMQAAQRHAAFRPALTAAEAALQRWLHGSCALGSLRTIRQALQYMLTEPPDEASRGTSRLTVARGSVATGTAGQTQHALNGALQSDQGADASRTAGHHGQLDFAALRHMKGTVRPTLSWEATSHIVSRPSNMAADSHASGSSSAKRAQNGLSAPSLARGNRAAEESVQGRSHTAGGRCKLYDVLVCNDGDTDALAVAHEVLRQALLPEPRAEDSLLVAVLSSIPPEVPADIMPPERLPVQQQLLAHLSLSFMPTPL